MYLSDTETGLGVTPIDAVFAVASLKNLFGFGKKKRELKAIDQNAKGVWTSQFPPYADWEEYINRPQAPNPNAKSKNAKAISGKTHAEAYRYWRGRRDSILIKNQIATPEDYGAWIVATYGLKDKWIDPNAAPGSPLYDNAPYALGTKISIYDYPGIVKWAEKNAALTGAPASPVQLGPVAPPPKIAITPAPGFIDRWAANLVNQGVTPPDFFIPSAPSAQTSLQPAVPQSDTMSRLMLPAAIVGIAVIFAMSRKRGRK